MVKALSKDDILTWAIENPKEFKRMWDKVAIKKTAQKWMKANPAKAMKVWLGYNRQEALEFLTKKGGWK